MCGVPLVAPLAVVEDVSRGELTEVGACPEGGPFVLEYPHTILILIRDVEAIVPHRPPGRILQARRVLPIDGDGEELGRPASIRQTLVVVLFVLVPADLHPPS